LSITIRTATKDDQDRWDDFVHSQKGAGPYHLFAWKIAVEKAYYHRSYYLIAENERGNIQGALPLILIKPPFLKGYLVSLPFCDYGGVLTSDSATEEILVREAADLARSFKANLEIRCKQDNTSFNHSQGFGLSTHKSRMVLPLPGSSDALFNRFKSKLRSQIRRPQKEGLIFQMGSSELIDDFYCVFSRNMRELGSPVHSKNWIRSVLDSFGDKAHLGMVYKDDVPVAGGVILECGETVSIPWASTISKYNKMSPNMLLYWGFLKYASDNGYKLFDFGRSTPGEGTYKFKEQWGAEPYPLYWYNANSRRDATAGATVSFARKYVEKVWAMIPQVFTNGIGPLVRRYISL